MAQATSPARQFARSWVVMGGLYFGSTALGFLVGVILARFLGAADYGAYALAMTTATLAGLVTEFGLPTLAMREVGMARSSGAWGEVRGLLRWADRTILALSALVMLSFYLWHDLFAADRPSAFLHALLWGVALVPVVALGKLRALVLLALDRVFASQFPMMILRAALFIAGCLALRATGIHLTATVAMALQVGAAGAATIIAIILFLRYRPAPLASAVPRYAVRRWLSSCLPMGMTEGLRLLQGQMALLLVGALSGSLAAAGIYRVADAVTQMTMLVVSVAATAATPLFARLHGEGDREGIERLAVLAVIINVGGMLLLGLPVALGGHWLLPRVFGAEFEASLEPFVILWLGGVVVTSLGLVLTLANMIGRHIYATQAFGVIAAVNLVLGALLIPSLGNTGAALASVCASFTGTAFCAVRLYRSEGINATLFNPSGLRLAMSTLAETATRLAGRIGSSKIMDRHK